MPKSTYKPNVRIENPKTLRAEQGPYRLLFEKNPQPMWIYDLESLAFLAVNHAAVTQYGYSEDEFLRMTLLDIRPSEEIAETLEKVSQLGAGQQASSLTTHRKKDGSLIEVGIISYNCDWEGRQARLVLASDITEQKKAERDLRQFAAIVESSNDAIISRTLDGIMTSWNAGAEQIFGYTSGEVIGKPITILASPNQADGPLEVLAKINSGKCVVNFETTRLRKDGKAIVVSITVSPVKDENGEIVGASAIIRDITENKSAEERFYKAFNLNPEPMTIATISEGRYVDVNESFLRVTGFRRNEVIGRTSLELNIWERPEDRIRFVEILEKQGSIRDLEFLSRTKSGHCLLYTSPSPRDS